MKTRRMLPGVLAVLAGLVAVSARAGYLNENFDAAPFTNGATFVTAVSNWKASVAGVVVVSNKSYSGNQSIFLPEDGAISNAVAVTPTPPQVVWTDVRVAPHLGAAPDNPAPTGAGYLSYFGSNGYLHVWNGSAWLACSNDVWNQPVPALTNGVFATISVYQNFATHRAAVLVNDQVVAQDLAFANNTNIYTRFFFQNVSSNAWIDDAYVQTNYDGTRLTHDRNGVDGIDAAELAAYGYVARTFVVGASPYITLSNALVVARDRDTLQVAGTYNESVTITQNLTLAGSFTNSGTLTVAAGKTTTVSNGFTSSLMVNGTLALAQGVVVSGATVTVTGTVNVPTNNAWLLAGNLNITGGGMVAATGGRVVDAGVGIDLTGTFTLNNTWDTAAIVGLDFSDDFEQYAADTRLQALGFRGWGASDTGVLVKATQGYGGTKGALLPEATVLSNRIAGAGQPKVWTDYQIRPMAGDAPTSVRTNAMAFLGYVASNGSVNVWSAGGWLACTNYFNGSNIAALGTSTYARVTLFANFASGKSAIFVNGKLARELIGFPGGGTITNYGGFMAQNNEASAYLDELRITTGVPADLLALSAATDLDGDDTADADEIQRYDSILLWNGPRTLFRFR